MCSSVLFAMGSCVCVCVCVCAGEHSLLKLCVHSRALVRTLSLSSLRVCRSAVWVHEWVFSCTHRIIPRQKSVGAHTDVMCWPWKVRLRPLHEMVWWARWSLYYNCMHSRARACVLHPVRPCPKDALLDFEFYFLTGTSRYSIDIGRSMYE